MGSFQWFFQCQSSRTLNRNVVWGLLLGRVDIAWISKITKEEKVKEELGAIIVFTSPPWMRWTRLCWLRAMTDENTRRKQRQQALGLGRPTRDPDTPDTLCLPQEVKEADSDLAFWFVCLKDRLSFVMLSVSTPQLWGKSGLAVDLTGQQLSWQGHWSVFYGPAPPGLNGGTRATLAGLVAGAGPLSVLPSSAQ